MREPPTPTGLLLGYARVSTDDQDLTLQRDALLNYGVREDCIYADHGVSGAKWTRPAFDRMMKHMRQGDTIVVWKLDRLGRTLRGLVETIDRINAEGAHFHSIGEHIDTTTPHGRVYFHIIAAMAQLERDLISERTKAGMAAKRAAGQQFGQRGMIEYNPKRLDAIRPYFESGAVQRGEITARQALEILNAADRKAKPIRSEATWRRWLKEGAPGVDG